MSAESEYLLGLFIVEQRSSPPVSSGRLAQSVDRSPAATTEMIQRLEAKGLVDHEPYEGVRLTASGRDRAEELHETYAALSWFFRAVLDLDDHETEAMRMAGLVSPSVAERLVETLLAPDESRAETEDLRSDDSE